ncbi:hypothetical protein CROQUDRAFT_670500 [Cronartium quercuum f. sp. fusiforme G11]|uniref:Wax synthase domain-containing protein n=1 Tax=Cronartium quercuum f. sp. fusiforme G11 TaxID=708437 RepID=A0A9P6NK70_9BASI|nr:hypothetical protein CROQUDRAFT_670500 [Cronartium quercuum f. sp. fusiforme G11]
MVANTLSTSHLILRYLHLSIVQTCVLALIVLMQDSLLRTPISCLLSIGIPNFLGLRLFAELVHAASFAIWLLCHMDTTFTFVTLLATDFHKLSIYFHFPEPILKLCDLVYYPPMFDFPYKKLGASQRMQRIAGLFGIFAASTFIHEYRVFLIIQPFAMLIEPYIIPLIPKSLGGGQLWVWAFSSLASYLFRVQCLAEDQMVAHFPPLSQWSWTYIISPIK